MDGVRQALIYSVNSWPKPGQFATFVATLVTICTDRKSFMFGLHSTKTAIFANRKTSASLWLRSIPAWQFHSSLNFNQTWLSTGSFSNLRSRSRSEVRIRSIPLTATYPVWILLATHTRIQSRLLPMPKKEAIDTSFRQKSLGTCECFIYVERCG